MDTIIKSTALSEGKFEFRYQNNNVERNERRKKGLRPNSECIEVAKGASKWEKSL